MKKLIVIYGISYTKDNCTAAFSLVSAIELVATGSTTIEDEVNRIKKELNAITINWYFVDQSVIDQLK